MPVGEHVDVDEPEVERRHRREEGGQLVLELGVEEPPGPEGREQRDVRVGGERGCFRDRHDQSRDLECGHAHADARSTVIRAPVESPVLLRAGRFRPMEVIGGGSSRGSAHARHRR